MRDTKNKNGGYSLVMVLIAIGFVGMLVSVIMFMAYINLNIKVANLKNRDSFYTAENALEEVSTGLEKVASDAFGAAYLSIVQNYEIYSDSQRKDQFSYEYVTNLRNYLKYPAGTSLYDLSILNGFLVDTAWNATEGYGATVTTKAGALDYGTLVARTDGVLLKDLRVTYKGKDGNVSVIDTDILIKIPAISFQDSIQVPDIVNYIVVANDKIDVTWGSSVLAGSMYAGKEGININWTATDLHGIQTLITDGDFTIDRTSVSLRQDSVLWADGVKVTSASVSLNGTSYIKDDFTIEGTGANIVLSNGYYGYGYGDLNDPDDNSAFIINGTSTNLDMSGLSKLYIAGNAFIKSEGTVNFGAQDHNNTNVLLGESVAIKPEQIAYLVPDECLWVKDGVSLCKSNPVLFSKIQDYISQGATEVDLSVISKKLGVPVNNYANGYTRVYSNSGNVKVVNYYLTFSSREKAAKFFKAYYEADKARMDRYIKVYAPTIKLPNDEASRFNLCGNAFTMVNGTYELVSSTRATDDTSKLKLESDEYEKAYNQLCTTLTRVEPTPAQITEKNTNGIFFNIVDKTLLYKIVPNIGDKFENFDSTGQNGVLIINNGDTRINLSTASANIAKIKILVCTGDVYVDTSFNGVIISNGVITIGSSSLRPDAEGVSAAMQVTANVDGAEYMIVNLFSDGNYVVINDPSATTGTISIKQLISYENWREQ